MARFTSGGITKKRRRQWRYSNSALTPSTSARWAKLVGYFTTDAGTLNQLVHLWKFDDDADRRNHWTSLLADEGFQAFLAHFRPLLMMQENKLLLESPWGPHP